MPPPAASPAASSPAGSTRRLRAAVLAVGVLLCAAVAVLLVDGGTADLVGVGIVIVAAVVNVVAWRLATRSQVERAAATREAREAQVRFRSVFDSAPIGMVLISRDRQLLEVNSAFCEIFGARREDLVGRSTTSLVDPGDPRADADTVSAVLAGRAESWTTERRVVRFDGERRWARSHGALVRAADGSPLYAVAHVADITEQRRQQDALALSARELERRAQDLERSNSELEQFAYVASHDLSEPLRTVSGFVALLASRYEGKLDDDADMFIDYAVQGTRRMQDLIDDLLLYSRAGRPDKPVEDVNFEEVLDDVRGQLGAVTAERGGVIEAGPLPRVLGDRVQLVQLVQNLVANALKFTPEGTAPQIRVTAEELDQRCVQVVVEDEGIGIDPAFSERIFKMFQRLHERNAYTGTGIGLALCEKIVDRHGGRIWHEPAAGGGSRFCFTLPLATAPAGAGRVEAARELGAPPRRAPRAPVG